MEHTAEVDTFPGFIISLFFTLSHMGRDTGISESLSVTELEITTGLSTVSRAAFRGRRSWADP